MGAFLSLSTSASTFTVPLTLSPLPPPPSLTLRSPKGGKHGERVYSSPRCPLFTPSFCTLYVYYIRWRAPPFFVSHKGWTMTAVRCVRSLMFYPSVCLLFTSSSGPRNSFLSRILYVSLAFFFLHCLVANRCSGMLQFFHFHFFVLRFFRTLVINYY